MFLPLERVERQLKVTLETDDKWLPEQTASVTLRVDNLAKQSAVVTLAAVDAEVLQEPAVTTGSGNNAEARRVEVKLVD